MDVALWASHTMIDESVALTLLLFAEPTTSWIRRLSSAVRAVNRNYAFMHMYRHLLSRQLLLSMDDRWIDVKRTNNVDDLIANYYLKIGKNGNTIETVTEVPKEPTMINTLVIQIPYILEAKCCRRNAELRKQYDIEGGDWSWRECFDLNYRPECLGKNIGRRPQKRVLPRPCHNRNVHHNLDELRLPLHGQMQRSVPRTACPLDGRRIDSMVLWRMIDLLIDCARSCCPRSETVFVVPYEFSEHARGISHSQCSLVGKREIQVHAMASEIFDFDHFRREFIMRCPIPSGHVFIDSDSGNNDRLCRWRARVTISNDDVTDVIAEEQENATIDDVISGEYDLYHNLQFSLFFYLGDVHRDSFVNIDFGEVHESFNTVDDCSRNNFVSNGNGERNCATCSKQCEPLPGLKCAITSCIRYKAIFDEEVKTRTSSPDITTTTSCCTTKLIASFRHEDEERERDVNRRMVRRRLLYEFDGDDSAAAALQRAADEDEDDDSERQQNEDENDDDEDDDDDYDTDEERLFSFRRSMQQRRLRRLRQREKKQRPRPRFFVTMSDYSRWHRFAWSIVRNQSNSLNMFNEQCNRIQTFNRISNFQSDNTVLLPIDSKIEWFGMICNTPSLSIHTKAL